MHHYAKFIEYQCQLYSELENEVILLEKSECHNIFHITKNEHCTQVQTMTKLYYNIKSLHIKDTITIFDEV